ncbi:hypothetical protein ACH4Y0_00985 [Streptomyces sp. NPDC020707]|jgi:hypothetical protein|uniref:hypothetical protein n=1 Tax=Streptomyces sp. NPDC020707 TaxID=3365084 RepID=UPI0037A68735
MSAQKGSVSHAEQVLAAAGRRLRARQPGFDVAAGLLRLARDAGYSPVPDTVPSVSRALRHLEEFVSWSLDQPGATTHVERYAATLGESDAYRLLTRDRDTEEIDLDGAHVFACMLYLAGHPESAQFWWRFTAGAGSGASALCLQLLHRSRGETAEAEHWREMLLLVVDLDDDVAVKTTFVTTVGRFAAYTRRHRPPAPVTPALNAEVRRLATQDDAADRLVCRPDAGLARRLQDCTGSR